MKSNCPGHQPVLSPMINKARTHQNLTKSLITSCVWHNVTICQRAIEENRPMVLVCPQLKATEAHTGKRTSDQQTRPALMHATDVQRSVVQVVMKSHSGT